MSTLVKPLQNKRVLITRPKEQSEAFIQLLKDESAIPVLMPVFRIAPINDALQNINLSDYSSIIFTSAQAVKYFLKLVSKIPQPIRIIAVGNKTEAALKEKSISVDFIPSEFSGKKLAKELSISKDEKIFYPCSSLSNDEIKKKLEMRGAIVKQISVYQNVENDLSKSETDKIFSKPFDFITFTSGSAVKGFLKLMPKDFTLESSKIVCIGPSTAKVASEFGLKIGGIAESHNIEGMIEKMRAMINPIATNALIKGKLKN